jgi:hypothetical protein
VLPAVIECESLMELGGLCKRQLRREVWTSGWVQCSAKLIDQEVDKQDMARRDGEWLLPPDWTAEFGSITAVAVLEQNLATFALHSCGGEPAICLR